MAKNGGSLEKLQLNRMLKEENSVDLLFQILKHNPNLICLNLSNNQMGFEDVKAIKKVLSDFKTIRELDISDCSLNALYTKEIADGLVMAKKLEIFKAVNNCQMGEAINTLIYNLSFLPSLKMIDLSGCKTVKSVETLTKFFKIAMSIETFIMQNCMDTENTYDIDNDIFSEISQLYVAIALN